MQDFTSNSIHVSHSPEDTFSLGEVFAKSLRPQDVVGLAGNLGTGKTQFVKGVCSYFNVSDLVNSPTFVIVNEYKGSVPVSSSRINIIHFDLFRLKSINDFQNIGIENYVNNESICLIEWSELAEKYFKGNIKKVSFEHGEEDKDRIITFP